MVDDNGKNENEKVKTENQALGRGRGQRQEQYCDAHCPSVFQSHVPIVILIML